MANLLWNLLKRWRLIDEHHPQPGARESCAWQGEDRLRIVVTEAFSRPFSFVRPNPWMRAVGSLVGGADPVCSVGYGVSPLGNRVYVDGIQVVERLRGQEYATELLVRVSRMAGSGVPLAMTALHETWSAQGFWDKLRSRRPFGLLVTQDVPFGEMDDEAAQWRGEGGSSEQLRSS